MKESVLTFDTSGRLRHLSNGDCIIIADLEKQCVNLSSPITETNFKEWWNVVRFYVLERWHGSREAYEEVLTQIVHRACDMMLRLNGRYEPVIAKKLLAQAGGLLYRVFSIFNEYNKWKQKLISRSLAWP